MKHVIWVLLLIAACGTKKNSPDGPSTTADSLAAITDPAAKRTTADSAGSPTAAAIEINSLLGQLYGDTLLVVNDIKANWPKDEFDYFIAPKRKDLPDYPYIAKGDFNGDGKEDAAALVKSSNDGKYQVAVFFGAPLSRDRVVFWNEDIDVCAVSTYPKGPLEGMESGKVNMKGDGVNIEFFERGSFVLYWDGSKFKRAQTGD